jgi:uncharacterized protein YxeA
MTFILVTIFVLLILIIIVGVSRRNRDVINDDYDDEVTHTTVTTTTTTDQPAPAAIATVGTIYAFQEAGNTQWYVNDPVDKEKTAVNANDDYYRDAGGSVWNLQ